MSNGYGSPIIISAIAYLFGLVARPGNNRMSSILIWFWCIGRITGKDLCVDWVASLSFSSKNAGPIGNRLVGGSAFSLFISELEIIECEENVNENNFIVLW